MAIGSNSYKEKEEAQPKSFVDEPITEDVETVMPIKDTLIDIFFGEAIRNLQHRNPFLLVLQKYIAPKIIDGVFEFAEELFYSNRSTTRKRSSGNFGTPYNSFSMFGGSNQTKTSRLDSEESKDDDYRYFTTSDRGVAEEILLEMRTIIDENGYIRVGDLYRMFKKTPTDYQMWAYGWKTGDLDDVRPKIVRGGRWSLNLPMPRKIGK